MNKETSLQTFTVRLLAILLIAGGVGAVKDTIFHGFIHIDFQFLGLFIGAGLLNHKEIWRKWAVFVLWCGILCSVVGIVLTIFGFTEPYVTIAGTEFRPEHSAIVTAILLFVFGAFCFWQQWVLTRPIVKETFSAIGEKNRWWMPIAAASLLFFGTMEYQNSLTGQLLKSIEHYEATIHAFDAKTNARLNPAIGLPSVRSKEIFPRTGVCATEDGIMVSGLGIEPIEVGVSVKGYQEKKIKLPLSHGHNTISVKLDRKEGGEQNKVKPDDQDTEGK